MKSQHKMAVTALALLSTLSFTIGTHYVAIAEENTNPTTRVFEDEGIVPPIAFDGDEGIIPPVSNVTQVAQKERPNAQSNTVKTESKNSQNVEIEDAIETQPINQENETPSEQQGTYNTKDTQAPPTPPTQAPPAQQTPEPTPPPAPEPQLEVATPTNPYIEITGYCFESVDNPCAQNALNAHNYVWNDFDGTNLSTIASHWNDTIANMTPGDIIDTNKGSFRIDYIHLIPWGASMNTGDLPPGIAFQTCTGQGIRLAYASYV